jgi:DNA-binding NarL/FixJ family response regulator
VCVSFCRGAKKSKVIPIRLLIADRSSMHCELLAHAVKRDPAIEVVSAVSSKSELLEFSTRIAFDVALIAWPLEDVVAPGLVIRELRHRSPAVRSILFLDTPSCELAVECLAAGARGIFPKKWHTGIVMQVRAPSLRGLSLGHSNRVAVNIGCRGHKH